ncbi:hypothetical protein H4R18_002561 [Coemansia javaensis]|uniref:J domain-containing protein n=1 Tax=Coemansia javaensis TaxID=2761396 RepID=A0A9W8HEQ0_9FUNG|nr:hypothetical protein H4R18_002561 [Coemansia javaensis]
MAADYYGLLGVPPTASPAEIRTAYMKRALEMHPDRNPSPAATAEFQALADAYHTLSDPARRAEYDRAPRAGARPSADADGVFGDVFEDMLRPEVGSPGALWSMLGLAGGAILGLVVANVPGAVVGGLVGRRLGAIRDRSGRPVYDAFRDLPHARKAQVLAALATQLLSPR